MSALKNNTATPQYVVPTPGDTTISSSLKKEHKSMQYHSTTSEVNLFCHQDEPSCHQMESSGYQNKTMSPQRSISTTTGMLQSVRIENLQSSSSLTLESNIGHQTASIPTVYLQNTSKTVMSALDLSQNTNSMSSVSIASSEKQIASCSAINRGTVLLQKTNCSSTMTSSSTSQCLTTKGKFQSFLQQPGAAQGSSGNLLMAHQKHVLQFARSSSAQGDVANFAMINKSQAMTRNSLDIGDGNVPIGVESTENINSVECTRKLSSVNQSSNMTLSKSAETIEIKSSIPGTFATSSVTGTRTQLTSSTGRRITILSPMHAPAGIQDLLKCPGRSPLSTRINLSGNDTELSG